jgi:[ribosomal protein S5]-alanine N-acetyltransferase
MEFKLSDGYTMSPPTRDDIPAFIKHLNDPYIFARTLMLPADYSEKDGEFFVGLCESHEKQFGHPIHFNIRNPKGETIGGAGFHGKNNIPQLAHRDEIGYWLATEYRGKGIMTQAVQALVNYGFGVRKLLRIEAPVYTMNVESAAVLKRCGFTEEGYSPKMYFRNGEYHDARLFAITR